MLQKIKLLLVSILLCTAVCGSVVSATETSTEPAGQQDIIEGAGSSNEAWSTGNAINDILSSSRYQGAIESISWLTTRTDSIFTMVITFAAFAIISVSLLKMALAGLYVVFPKFFDRVSDAHKRVEAWSLSSVKQYFTGGGYNNTSAGAIRDTLLAIVPDVKAFTDFEDGMVDPKHYFMKAIPQMVVFVIIGVFIYNGYYRDVALLVGSVGAEAFERVFWGVDPEAVLDRLTQTTGMPDFATDGATDTQGKLINDITKRTYRAVIGKYTDITSATAKARLGSQIESWAISNFGIDSPYCGPYVSEENPEAIYKYSVDDVMLSLSNIQSSVTTSTSGDNATATICTKLSEVATFDSTKEPGMEYYVIVRVTFARQADDGSAGGANQHYEASDVTTDLNNTHSVVKLPQGDTVTCNASGGMIYAPSGYRFYVSNSNATAVVSDGITISMTDLNRGYYTQIPYTGSPSGNAEVISFERYYQTIVLVNDAGTTQHRFRITVVG